MTDQNVRPVPSAEFSDVNPDLPATTTPQEDADYKAWLAEREAAKPVEKKSNTVDTGRSDAPTEAVKSEVRVQEVQEDEVPQSYVWLPNGKVLLVNDEDLPVHSGKGAENGFWESEGKVYQIAFVFPRETTIKEN
jgi:hypothetical protein